MRKLSVILSVLVLVVFCGCTVCPETAKLRDIHSDKVQMAISEFKRVDPRIQTYFDSSYGYAVLPRVNKSAIVIGHADGQGQVFEQGSMIGQCSLTQTAFGLSGCEYFREIIFFKNERDLDNFRSEQFVLPAYTTTTAITADAVARTDYKNGMAVFIMTDEGMMLDDSGISQRFSYTPRMLKGQYAMK